jgi:hypothetical protein
LSKAKVKTKAGTAKIITLKINLFGMAKECNEKNAMMPTMKKMEYRKIISFSRASISGRWGVYGRRGPEGV